MGYLKYGAIVAAVLAAFVFASSASASTYTVQRGDSLWGISRSHHVELGQLIGANAAIRNPDRIYAGQVITIPDQPAPAAAGAGSSGSAPAPAAAARVTVAANPPRNSPARTLLVEAARRHGLNPSFVLAVAWWESGWNPGAVSSTGAIGMMQVEPYTADWAGPRFLGRKVNLKDPRDNAELGAALLRHYLDVFNDPKLALAAYYQGETGTRKYGVYDSSRPYVNGIWALRNRFQEGL